MTNTKTKSYDSKITVFILILIFIIFLALLSGYPHDTIVEL